MEIVIIVVVAIVVLAAAGYFYMSSQNKKRTDDLRGRFGPEYEKTVVDTGDRKHAEAELQERERRVSKMDIRSLSETQRQDYAEQWRSIQARFVDNPAGAMNDADTLVNQVMTARGYPMGEWEARSADISVDHPQVVANYRAARAVSDKNDAGEANTEDQRQAIVHYRALFDELLMPEPVTAQR